MSPEGDGRRGPRRTTRTRRRARPPSTDEAFEEEALDEDELDEGELDDDGPLTQMAIELATAVRRIFSDRVPPRAIGHLFKAQREMLLAAAAVIEHNRRRPKDDQGAGSEGSRSSRSSRASGSTRRSPSSRRSSAGSASGRTEARASGRRPTRVELD